MEQTFIMIKPDGVQRGLVGEIIGKFEKKGFYLKGLKFMTVDRAFAEKHYADLSAKPFFNGLVNYIVSGPIVAMIWEGKGVVSTGRKLIGATNPLESAPGTICGDYAIDIGRNVIHLMIQLIVHRRKKIFGSLKVLIGGVPANTLGSMSKKFYDYNYSQL